MKNMGVLLFLLAGVFQANFATASPDCVVIMAAITNNINKLCQSKLKPEDLYQEKELKKEEQVWFDVILNPLKKLELNKVTIKAKFLEVEWKKTLEATKKKPSDCITALAPIYINKFGSINGCLYTATKSNKYSDSFNDVIKAPLKNKKYAYFGYKTDRENLTNGALLFLSTINGKSKNEYSKYEGFYGLAREAGIKFRTRATKELPRNNEFNNEKNDFWQSAIIPQIYLDLVNDLEKEHKDKRLSKELIEEYKLKFLKWQVT